MYVLIRDDLTPGQQLAQSIHAAVEHALRKPKHVAATPTVVVLTVPDEDALLEQSERLQDEYLYHTLFQEPDLDGSFTALSVICTGHRFSTLPLAGRCVV